VRNLLWLCLFLLLSCSSEVEKEPYTFEVQTSSFEVVIEATGHLRAVKATPIQLSSTQRGGRTVAWIEQEGTMVKAGDPLIRLDDFELKQRREAGKNHIAIVNLDTQIQKLTFQLDSLQARNDLKLLHQERDQASAFSLDDPELFSREERIQSEANLELLETKIRHKQEALQRLSDQENAELQLLELKKQRHQMELDQIEGALTETEITAPHDGIFFPKDTWQGKVSAGVTVWPGLTLGELPDIYEMEAVVYVLESDAAGLKPGIPARLQLDAAPGFVLKGEIKTIGTLAQPLIRESPVKYFEVVISIEETKPEFMKPDSYVKASLQVERLEDVLHVPNQVIFHEGEENWVYLKQSNEFEKRLVETGTRSVSRTVITSGLVAGDAVAMSRPEGLD
jgi:multidrug efflux pump subunit AcrA (membrane-fusion protein)